MVVRGVVQGVGYRPFVYRVALELGVRGWVLNDTGGVTVHAEGEGEVLRALAVALRERAPGAARVDEVLVERAGVEGFEGFSIRKSAEAGAPTTRISPDLCVCADCLREMREPGDRRAGYAYINCTNCGPRYSIIRSLPYDRPRTTMAGWALCDACRGEYEEPLDRRYHAQPTACGACGPGYRLVVDGAEVCGRGEAIGRAARMLSEGAILAVKGIGGYHLACDASDAGAVGRLRERKFRKEKPFAVMVRDLAAAEGLVELSGAHRAALGSVARPIVLARGRRVLEGVHPGTGEIGVMLAYTPLHHLLFDLGAPEPLVLTSANRSSEPIAYEDEAAFEGLAGLADGFLVGERAIQRRVDDSVVAVRGVAAVVVRRARGYAPGSVAKLDAGRAILAVGADLKNAVALAVGGEVFVGQHDGDLGELETDRAFGETIEDLLSMYAVDRGSLVVAHDLHPGYVSTRAALGMEAGERVGVQHHEAHVASVLLEHGELETPVVGVALDGTGWGRDGTIWGGEVFRGSVVLGFERVGSLSEVMMPGGDAAARHPVQAAAAFLGAFDAGVLESEPFGFPARFRQARGMVAKGVRCFGSTSAGRVFDAAAAVCGFTREITYEGQAAIWLEQLAEGAAAEAEGDERWLDPRVLVGRMVEERLGGAEPAVVAARFHARLAGALAARARREAEGAGIGTVVLSGGVWQNRRLFAEFGAALGGGLRVLTNREVPCNDGGISAGQVALAWAALRGGGFGVGGFGGRD